MAWCSPTGTSSAMRRASSPSCFPTASAPRRSLSRRTGCGTWPRWPFGSPTRRPWHWPQLRPSRASRSPSPATAAATIGPRPARCTQYVAPAMNQPYEMVEVGTAARQGDSGGPIFNSRGELAGVLFGAGYGTTSGSYSGRVRGFLESVLPAGNASPDNSTIAARSSEQATRLSAVVPGDRGSSGARQPSSAAGYDRSMRGHASAAGSPSNVVSSAGQAAPPGETQSQLPEEAVPLHRSRPFWPWWAALRLCCRRVKLLRPRPKPEVTVENGETAKSGRGKAKR